jgi:pyridoxamine 5'-phosphate oxidase
VLLKQIEQLGSGQGAFVFFTNYDSVKGGELAAAGKAAFVLHSKTQQRQMRVRGLVSREDGSAADDYFASRSLKSRLGAWASKQSQPLDSRASLLADVARVTAQYGTNPPRPPFWGGFRITPLEIEFWADGAFRLHDRFRWSRATPAAEWQIQRLNP